MSVEPKAEPVKTESTETHEGGSERGQNNQGGGFRRGGSRGRGGRFSDSGGRGGQGGGERRGPRGEGNNEGQNHRNDGEFNNRGARRGRGGFRGSRDGGQGRGGGDDNDQDGGFRGRGPVDKIQQQLNQLGGPTFEIPSVDMSEKKFNGRNRLYVGNIGNEVTEEEIVEMFNKYGETAEIFLNKEKNFGFIKLDFFANAEKAKNELDGTMVKGRTLKVRFAPSSSTIKVRNLSSMVTNELLHYAFSPFGEIEKALVTVDERGKPTGEGIVHFARKFSAAHAVRKCTESCYFLTAVPQPVFVEPFELVDDHDGYSDKNINKKNLDYQKEREMGPRVAHPGSFEYEYGQRWKVLYEMIAQKEEALKKEMELEKEKLIAQMEYARYEHETEMLRNQLRAREMDKERQKREWEMKERQAEEERLRSEEALRRSQEEMEARMIASQEEIRRRQQENNLFMQAHNLDSLLDQTEQAYDVPSNYLEGQATTGVDLDPKQFMSSYERGGGGSSSGGHSRDEGGRGYSGQRSSGSRGHWVSDNRRADDFQSKRRRY